MAKFVLEPAAKGGYKFNLKASNGQVVATSQVYKALDGARKGIESVKTIAADAAVEDQTKEGFAAEKNPKFEVYADKAGEFRFRLKAKNGQIVATSEGYKALRSCLNGVESVKKSADAKTEENL